MPDICGLLLEEFSAKARTPVNVSKLIPFFNSKSIRTLSFHGLAETGPVLSKLAISRSVLSQLHTLYLTDSQDTTEDDLANIILYCTNIKDLKITHSRGVTDFLMNVLSSENQFEYVDFSYCCMLTNLGLISLIENQVVPLKKLVIIGCEGISPKTVEWARLQVYSLVV